MFAVFAFRCLDRFAGAGHDDTFITLLAAEQLADGQGLVTPNGEPGEIGSSLLHVVVLAALRSLGVPDLFLANKLLGLTCGGAALVVILAHRERLFAGARSTLMPALLATGLAAWWPSYAFWSMGGLETPLAALLVTILAVTLARDTDDAPARVGATAALITLVRPEGFTFLAAVACCGIAQRRSPRWWKWAFGAPLLFVGCASGVRWLYLGSVFPLPVLAKTANGPSLARLAAGLDYLSAFGRASPLAVMVLAGFAARAIQLLATTPRRPWMREEAGRFVLATVVAVSFGTTAISGGDWMAYYRFVTPVLPALGVLASQWLWDPQVFRASSQRTQTVLTVLMLAATPLLTLERSGLSAPHMPNTCMQQSWRDLTDARVGLTFGERVRTLNHPYWRDKGQLRPFLTQWLAPALARRKSITLATYQMGFLPYELRLHGMKNVRLIDTVGIADPHLARLPGARSSFGLTVGIEPDRFLDPASSDPVATAIQASHPDLVYLLRVDAQQVEKLRRWGWAAVWNAPEAKIFAQISLLADLRRKN